jgi:hypothetical protein
MALSILDGNQSATTLSTIVTSGQHIPAHTVVSLGTQAITNISSAISGSTVCVGNLGLLQSTVATEGLSASGSFIKIGGHAGTSTTGNIVHVSSVGALRVDGSVYTQPVSIASVTIGNTVTISGTVTANPTGTQTIAGTVTANGGNFTQSIFDALDNYSINFNERFPVYAVIDPLPVGTNRIGVVTIGGGTVTIGAGTAQIGSVTASLSAGTEEIGTVKPAKSQTGVAKFLAVDDATSKLFTSTELTAGTAQIGSVTASISGTVPISISSVTVGNSVTIGSLPAISGTVTANTFALQGTAVTTSNFTSTTPSTVLANFNATREVLTIFSEGPGQLFVCAGATCTTIAYQVRLSAGDYYEVPNHQTTITHSAVFATAGTARVTQVS